MGRSFDTQCKVDKEYTSLRERQKTKATGTNLYMLQTTHRQKIHRADIYLRYKIKHQSLTYYTN